MAIKETLKLHVSREASSKNPKSTICTTEFIENPPSPVTPLPVFNVISGGIVGVGFRAGNSLKDKSGSVRDVIRKLEGNIAVGVNVFNATRCRLEPKKLVSDDDVVMPQMAVAPSLAEAMLVRQRRRVLPQGCQGAAVWQIGHLDNLLIVAWSVPYSHTLSHNLLAVGVADSSRDLSSNLLKDMLKGPEVDWFARKAFPHCREEKNNCFFRENLILTLRGFHVMASMGKGHKAEVEVTFMPVVKEELAPSLIRFMDEEDDDEIDLDE